MKAVVLAYSDVGCVGLKSLITAGYDVVAVFTHVDDPHETQWFGSVAELAAQHGIPVYAPEDISHPIWVKKIKDLEPDILFSFFYRKMVKKAILDISPGGNLNLHGSLLPKYRGRAPINWVLVHGEKETGVTLHYMTPKPDDGDIVGQKVIEIASEDTARTLMQKATVATEKLLGEVLPLIKSGKAPRTPQDNSKASYFGGRKPADGEIQWDQSATQIRNLVRAVTKPYPGAYTYLGEKKVFIWEAAELPPSAGHEIAGTVVSLDPFIIATGKGRLKIESGQIDKGLFITGTQLARELGVVVGSHFGPKASTFAARNRKKKVLILGVNGFIGNHLTERLLESGNYEVHGMDLYPTQIKRLMGRPGFYFSEGDISVHREWIEHHIKKCDIVLPLVAIATPIEYARNPLRVFELDFEENLRIVRYCVKYGKRVIFPSTSEVYGMCEEAEFDEDNSKLVLGPIRMQRWIYSCSKQLLDRVIWAYGQKENLRFTLFRPFNWIGPRLDSLSSARIGSSRAITQLILNLVEGTPIQLIDGGLQRRCFTDVTDGVEALFRIIENEGEKCDRQILNIGNPDNEASIREQAEMLLEKFNKHPLRSKFPPFAGFREVESGAYYGSGYQDVQHRKPSIKNAKKLIGWTPKIGLEQSIETTLDFFLRQAVESGDFRLNEPSIHGE